MNEREEPSQLRALKDNGGFWVPNFLIDNGFSKLNTRGVTLYCLLCRYTTLASYPSVEYLARLLKISQVRVGELLVTMLKLKLINEHDMFRLQGAHTHDDGKSVSEPGTGEEAETE